MPYWCSATYLAALVLEVTSHASIALADPAAAAARLQKKYVALWLQQQQRTAEAVRSAMDSAAALDPA